MQIPVFVRETLSVAGAQRTSPPIDLSNVPFFIVGFITHVIAGSTPTLDVDIETSDDLDTWADLGLTIQGDTTGEYLRTAVDLKTTPCGRYIRVKMSGAGTSLTVEFSVYINTYPST
jgi:hypothetical protein